MLVEVGVIAAVVVFVFIIAILTGGRMTRSELEKDIEKFFLSSENISDQRYFKYSLLENQHHISNARLKHGGKFNPGQKWFPIYLCKIRTEIVKFLKEHAATGAKGGKISYERSKSLGGK